MTIPYHTPDSTWEAWDCYTFGQFISKFLVKGVFHPNVPEDVVKSYLIVEHMVAHAWYYYPAMDEALSKALLITEMAVKLRCRELGLQTSIKSVNGKILDVKLAKLTDQLLQLEPDKDIEHLLHWARINRNRIAHPNQHSYGMGIMVNFKFVVSLLNLLFLTNEAVKNQISESTRLQNELNRHLTGCLVVALPDQLIIAWKILVLYAICVRNQWKYVISISCVDANAATNIPEDTYLMPISFIANSVRFTNKSVIFITDDDNKIIEIEVNNDPENLHFYTEHMRIIEKLTSDPTNFNAYRMQSIESSENLKIKYDFVYRYIAMVNQQDVSN